MTIYDLKNSCVLIQKNLEVPNGFRKICLSLGRDTEVLYSWVASFDSLRFIPLPVE